MNSKKLFKQILTLMLVGTMLIATACSSNKDKGDNGDTATDGEGTQVITMTMGRQTLQNPKLPEGDTYEDNAYTRWVKDRLNVKIVDLFEANGDDYDRQVSLALSSGDMPDMMKVNTMDELRELYENDLIADLSAAYEEHASENLKKIYNSYGSRAIDNVTFDGKMMALPGTNTDSGPSEVWIRSDWMEQLGLTIDPDNNKTITIEELENLAKAFMEANLGNAENPVGIAYAPWIVSGDSDGTFSANSVAYALGAFPKTWMERDGQVIYGSTTEEMKATLKQINTWFNNGLVDPQLGTRTWDDITSLLINGETGITFGTWHIPDWLLNNVRAMDQSVTLESYAVETAEGKVNCKHNNATAGYMVVRKGFKHPEVAVQIANMFYDEMVNSPTLNVDNPDVYTYQTTGVDGSTRPFNIEVNSYTSLLDDYSDIEQGVAGTISMDEVRTTESKSVIEAAKLYIENPETAEVVNWSKYHSRMKGIELIQTLTENDQFNWLTPVFPDTTPTMETNWANLNKLEEEAFIMMATGAVDVETGFDKFVNDWYAQGGEQIIKEIEEQLK